jgi:hypothetical protein
MEQNTISTLTPKERYVRHSVAYLPDCWGQKKLGMWDFWGRFETWWDMSQKKIASCSSEYKKHEFMTECECGMQALFVAPGQEPFGTEHVYGRAEAGPSSKKWPTHLCQNILRIKHAISYLHVQVHILVPSSRASAVLSLMASGAKLNLSSNKMRVYPLPCANQYVSTRVIGSSSHTKVVLMLAMSMPKPRSFSSQSIFPNILQMMRLLLVC